MTVVDSFLLERHDLEPDFMVFDTQISEPADIATFHITEDGDSCESQTEAWGRMIYLIYGPEGARKPSLRFRGSDQWNNPSLIRPAIKDILNPP